MIYHLKRIGTTGYDEAHEMVVRASSARQARKFASQNHGDEGQAVWTDKTRTTCNVVPRSGKPLLICRDYCNG